MGTFFMSIEIAGSDRERFKTVDVLVNTGAPYTMLPTSFLRSLGVPPIGKRGFRLPDGDRIYKDVGEAVIRIDGEVRTTIVVFEAEDSRPILGWVTLGVFSLGVDTVNQSLIPITPIGRA